MSRPIEASDFLARRRAATGDGRIAPPYVEFIAPQNLKGGFLCLDGDPRHPETVYSSGKDGHVTWIFHFGAWDPNGPHPEIQPCQLQYKETGAWVALARDGFGMAATADSQEGAFVFTTELTTAGMVVRAKLEDGRVMHYKMTQESDPPGLVTGTLEPPDDIDAYTWRMWVPLK
jgi:hypothetical protein